MKKWTLLIRKQDKNIFERIRSGEKTIDTRSSNPNSPKKSIAVGDILLFKCDGKSVEKKVKEIRKYSEFEEYLEKEDLENILGKGTTKEDARKIHYSFPSYKERLEKYGIVAFDLESI